MKKVIIASLVLSTCMFGCKKDKNDDPTPSTPTPKTKTQYLTAHSWKWVSSTADKEVDIDGNGSSSTNIMEQRAACANDNVLTFSAGETKTGSLDEGPSKCGDNPQASNFNWEWNDSETVIKLKGSVIPITIEEYTILQLDDNTLKVTYGGKDENDVAYIATDILVKP